MPAVDLTALGERGLTAEQIATERGHADVAMLLRFARQSLPGPLGAVDRGDMDTLHAGCNPPPLLCVRVCVCVWATRTAVSARMGGEGVEGRRLGGWVGGLGEGWWVVSEVWLLAEGRGVCACAFVGLRGV